MIKRRGFLCDAFCLLGFHWTKMIVYIDATAHVHERRETLRILN